MAEQRPNQYDWFKKGNNAGKASDPKDSLKTVWKFIKIFLYLSLFIFTLWGCAQIFVVKIENTVGRGVEFYANEAEIAPHTTVLKTRDITLGDGKEDSNTTSALEIYIPGTNYWLSDRTAAGKTDLTKVREEISKQNGTGDLKLQDAFKGSNEAIRVLGKDGKISDDDEANTGASEILYSTAAGTETPRPLVFSSIATEYYDSKLVHVYSDLAPDASSYDENGLISDTKVETTMNLDLPTPFTFYASQATDNTWTSKISKVNEYKFDYTFHKGQSKESVDKAFANWVDSNKYRSARLRYTASVLEAFATKFKGELPKEAFSGATGIVSGDKVPMSDLTTDQQKELLKYRNAETLLNYAGLSQHYANSAWDGDYDFANRFPGYAGSTDWRPLPSWGGAWKDEGPFYGLFVYPIATLSAKMLDAMPFMSGWETLWTMVVIVFSIRALTFMLSFKSTMQQTKMQELSAKKAVIDAKYVSYKGNKQMENRQRQEVSEMYKKEGVSPLGSLGSVFITMPFFLSIWRTIGALPHMKSTVWLGMNLGATSWRELFSGSFQYLPLILFAGFFAGFQTVFPRILTARRNKTRINIHQQAAMKKNNKTQNIMTVVFVIMAVVFNAGLQLYWIIGGIWMTGQSYFTHRLFVWQHKNARRKKIKT